MAYFLEHMEHTEEGKKLKLSDELVNTCRVVYKYNQEKDIWQFRSLWNKDEKYGDGDIIIPIQSVYCGWYKVRAGTVFSNVMGSTGDRLYASGANSWIGLIREVYYYINQRYNVNLNPDVCCTDEMYYVNHNQGMIHMGQCQGIAIGGHVNIGYEDPMEIDNGDCVELLPICKRHNSFKIDSGRGYPYIGYHGYRSGTDYHMKTRNDTVAIQLENYKQNTIIQEYMNTHGRENICKL